MGRLFLTVLKRFWVIILSVAIATAVSIGLMANSKADEFGESGQTYNFAQQDDTLFSPQIENNYFWEKASNNKIIPFPGYLKNVSYRMQYETKARNLSISKDTFEKLFSLISEAGKVNPPKSFIEGYELLLEYESEDGLSCDIELIGFNDDKTLYFEISSTEEESFIENSTGYIESAELVAFIKSIIGWKEFDIQNLSGTDEICVQVVSGIEKSDNVTIISGADAEYITNSIIRNSTRKDAGNCGYNIKIVFKNKDSREYCGFLTGDGCPYIAIEGRVFSIDSEILNMIYEKISYNVPFGDKAILP
ncbi:MAG TPA: hypothetical protein DEF39_08080 [Hungateiclostridium thermocellum]|uniref:Uncharacterized protein n=1 Tax=Acetivibrio thermocellus (strain ATCC 27405 / DSM 1237 / JCM 9322 / NBRC 103400 / NCIMB 10682 / NRRL B-4536 / VPI 7372) TaxID=203119 RepID=A3DFH5_ACET2|nr:hypothetical protein [Acetivibrio thermocellus]ABN52704.1 hypothetical protein Cthe_1475 [Acetivibrio thermocellus ATCC 27405]HBW27216.1 hypothetical protein [Acetivibrio thermocellus]